MAVGPVSDASDQAPEGRAFELPVFNASETDVEARVASLEGAVDAVRPGPATSISPGTWGVVGFSVIANCDTRASEPVRHVHLGVADGEDADREVRLALPGEGQVLVDYHRDLCRQGLRLSSNDLLGVWILDWAEGGRPGSMLWRFGRDGSFVADPEGGLFTDDTAFSGTYRLRGELLTIDVSGGYACRAGGQVVWQVALDGDDRMTLNFLRGTCLGEEDDLLVMFRVLRDAGLPGSR